MEYIAQPARTEDLGGQTAGREMSAEANTDEDKALLARFKLFGPPGIIFFDPRGEELINTRVVGFQDAETFLQTLASVKP